LTPSFTLNNQWTYHSDVDIGVSGNFKALSAGVTIAGDNYNLGPLVNRNFLPTHIGTVPQVTKSGSLGGFNTITADAVNMYPTSTTAAITGTEGTQGWYKGPATMTLTTKAMFDVASQHYKTTKESKTSTSVEDWQDYNNPVIYDDGYYKVDF
jgi:hypothetical protein